MVASVVYTFRSSFRGSKCCIDCPLIGFVVLASLHMLALASVVYTTCSCSAFRNLLALFVFENDFISSSFWARYVTVDQLLTRSNLGT